VSIGERAALRELLVALESGSRPKGGVKGIESGVPSLGGEHLDGNGGFRLDRLRYVPREFAASMRRGKIAVGDVLVVKDGATTGKVALVRDSFPHMDAVVNEHVFLCRCNERVDPRYVFWYLYSAEGQREILSDFRGAAQGGISQRFADLVQVPLRPIGEQRKIVAELEKQFSRLDEAVANLKRVKANFTRYKAAVLDAAVKGRLGSGCAPSDDDLPIGWRWCSVGELAIVGTGATPARSNEAFYQGGTVPWITSSAVNEPFVDAAEQFVTDEALRRTNLTLYPPGTLLVAMYGEGKTRGKCSELRIAATTNQALAAIQVDPAVRPWLKLFLEHNYDNTRRIASGGVQPNLNLGLIRAIRLPLPPSEERLRIVAEVDRCLTIVREVDSEVEANLKRAQALRQAVLARAFTSQP
jgi:type I restriction enzyme S subunit